MAVEGGSAGARARSLRAQAADARARADRLDSMARNYEAGEVGEQQVATALKPLEGPRCYVYHDRLLRPGRSKVNLDHVVVCEAGTYLIDAKNWTGHITTAHGSLRRDGRSRDREVDKVARMADEMTALTGTLVEPVVCLAGDRSLDFGEPQFIRGVHVVPVDHLAEWLLARPRAAAGSDLRTPAISIAATFPSATMPALLSIPNSHRSYSPARRPPLRRSSPGSSTRRGSSRRSSSRSRSEAQQLLRALALAAIALILLATSLGHSMIAGAVAAYTKHFTHTAASQTPNPAPCHQVTDAAVSAAIGQTVYRYQDGTGDRCTWGLVPQPNAYTVGEISVTTGYLAQPSAGTGRARYIGLSGSISLAVPQFAQVPGSHRAASTTTQPIYASVRYGGTVRYRGAVLTAAQAKRIVTAMVTLTAERLPTGPGSTVVRAR